MLAWGVVLLAIFLIGVTKSGFGSGVGLMIVPMTAIGLGYTPHGSEAALGLLLPLLIAGDLIAVWQYRQVFSLQIVRRLALGTLAGLLIGGFLLWLFHRHQALVEALMRLEIGVESILLVGLAWWRQWRGIQQQVMREPLRSHLTGTFAGTSSTLAHAAGPIIAMYLLPLGLDRRVFVGTSAIYFFLLNTSKLPVYAAAGQFAQSRFTFALLFLPLVIAGALFGFWINRRMNDRLFTRLVYVITFGLGWYLLFDGVAKLVRSL